MATPVDELKNGAEELDAVLRAWETGQTPENEWGHFYGRWLEGVKDRGWTRRDVYNLIHTISSNTNGFADRVREQLMEYEDGLTGMCSPGDIERFPGDARGGAFVDYVRSRQWL